MSVPKSERKATKFDVYNTVLMIRKRVSEVVLTDFRYDTAKFDREMDKRYGATMDEESLQIVKERYGRFHDFFMVEEKKAILNYLRELIAEVFTANSIYPMVYEEAIERRIHQDLALAKLHLLNQELQFVIDTLPVSIKEYFDLVPLIEQGINQIKAWRKSDNEKLKSLEKGQSLRSANFANVNGNGNANCNNASNSNGVRPILENPHDGNFAKKEGPSNHGRAHDE